MAKSEVTNAVFPIKFDAVHKESGHTVGVISTGVIDICNGEKTIKVLFIDQDGKTITMNTDEFNRTYNVELDND